MAKSLNLQIVAEGVEEEEQLNFLRQHDVAIAQGFFFSPPIPSEKFCSLLQLESRRV
jgi:sensor c-di-GMP phosphodiesterase-like protein